MFAPDPIKDSEQVWKVYKEHHTKVMMYMNGTDFLKAAAAIKDEMYDKQNPVYYHLVCQGLEILMKLILWQNRNIKPAEAKNKYGHGVKKLYEAMVEDKIISEPDEDMINDLDWWYSQHFLRYPVFHGLFMIRPDPTNIRSMESFIDQIEIAAKKINELERKAELPSV